MARGFTLPVQSLILSLVERALSSGYLRSQTLRVPPPVLPVHRRRLSVPTMRPPPCHQPARPGGATTARRIAPRAQNPARLNSPASRSKTRPGERGACTHQGGVRHQGDPGALRQGDHGHGFHSQVFERVGPGEKRVFPRLKSERNCRPQHAFFRVDLFRRRVQEKHHGCGGHAQSCPSQGIGPPRWSAGAGPACFLVADYAPGPKYL